MKLSQQPSIASTSLSQRFDEDREGFPRELADAAQHAELPPFLVLPMGPAVVRPLAAQVGRVQIGA